MKKRKEESGEGMEDGVAVVSWKKKRKGRQR
jgi:hypothetical protein